MARESIGSRVRLERAGGRMVEVLTGRLTSLASRNSMISCGKRLNSFSINHSL